MLKLSIIIPTYNSGEFLEQALLSIFNQTYKNFELIIVDGKSTDNTVDIIKKYNSSIHSWISEKDSSPADGTNKALKYVTGDIITFFGADDYYIDNTALEQMANEFAGNPHIDLLFSNINVIDRRTEEFISSSTNDNKLFFSLNKHDDSILRHIKLGYLTGLVFAGMSIRTAAMSDFQFDISNVVPDYEFILYMWRKGCHFHYIDHPLLNVRQGGVSQTAKTRLVLRDRFLVNKKFFGLLTAIKLYPWGSSPFIQYCRIHGFTFMRYLHNHGFRPLLWARTVISGMSSRRKS
ncbi:MAG: glycosyltransferase [Victivallaceae bacterium]|jgi:glycosyltransferase involved in cell wall biosynthesis